jgi:hypothetical protein
MRAISILWVLMDSYGSQLNRYISFFENMRGYPIRRSVTTQLNYVKNSRSSCQSNDLAIMGIKEWNAGPENCG